MSALSERVSDRRWTRWRRAPDLRPSWLIQRLNAPSAPPVSDLERFDQSLRMGKGAGLPKEAFGLVGQLFDFDYMGAAEFEFGAVPEALVRIARRARAYVAFEVEVPLRAVAAPEPYEDKLGSGASDPGDGAARIYVLCEAAHRRDVAERIRGWATERYNCDLKEPTRLAASLRPGSERDRRICGWLELDNAFFFTTSVAMWDAVATFFAIERASE